VKCALPYQPKRANRQWILHVNTTESGRPGIDPATCRVHDTIIVLYGCSVPLVIRPAADEEYHEIIGECYVQGYMDEEAVRVTALSGKSGKLLCLLTILPNTLQVSDRKECRENKRLQHLAFLSL
jgi:hypothetical protein